MTGSVSMPSVERNARVMSHSQFTSFYGTQSNEAKWNLGQSVGSSTSDPGAIQASFEDGFSDRDGNFGFWDMEVHMEGNAVATEMKFQIANVQQGTQAGIVDPSYNEDGPNWLSAFGSVASIFGIGTDISITGPKPVNLAKADWASQVKAGMKFSRGLNTAGLALTAIDIGVNGPNASNSMDSYFGVVAFGGPAGAAVGGAYFVGNVITTGITGKTIGQHVEANFYIIPMGALPGPPVMLIPK